MYRRNRRAAAVRAGIVAACAGAAVPAVEPPDSIQIVRRAVKVAQLTGDTDPQLQSPTANRTGSRYQLHGTDLGVSFRHKGRTYLLFGDTIGPPGGDAIAFTRDRRPGPELRLTFLEETPGLYRPVRIPGINQGAFEVPMAGISLSGRMFVFHTTDHTDRVTMGRSVVAASDDDGATFRLLSDLSRRHFINVSVCDVDARRWAGLPGASGRTLLYFGSGSYRASDMRLAAQPASNIGTRDGMRYCTGIGLDGRPTWSQSEEEAIGLLGQADIGELSVAYYPSLRKWVLLHNGHKPLRGIVMRTADAPWGPWSPGRLLFQPWLDGGYGRFMHVSRRAGGTDRLSDPGREDEWGGEYGPYQIPWFASVRGAETTIFFTMSTWNPYQVVLMKATLRRR